MRGKLSTGWREFDPAPGPYRAYGRHELRDAGRRRVRRALERSVELAVDKLGHPHLELDVHSRRPFLLIAAVGRVPRGGGAGSFCRLVSIEERLARRFHSINNRRRR
jgi:hypothetical protein